jgi:hypothetical protein
MMGGGVGKGSGQRLQKHDWSEIVSSLIGRLPLRSFTVAALLTVAPFSAFLYGTREYVGIGDIWRYPVAATGVVVALGICASIVLGRSWGARVSVVLGWLIFALFWYRDIGSFNDRHLSFASISSELVWVLVLVVGSVVAYRITSKPRLLKAGLLFSLTMAVLPLVQYGVATVDNGTGPGAKLDTANVDQWESRPDIYYLILDGLGRADVLEEIYEIDISGFIETLGREGFVVADRALSPHPMTWLSVPAVFNQEYQAYPGPRGRPATHSQTNRIMAGDSQTHEELAGQGYRFVMATEGGGQLCNLDLSPIQELATCLVKGDSLSAAIRERLGWLTPLHGLANRGLLPDVVRRWLAAEDLRWTDGKKKQDGTFMADDVLRAVDSVKEEHALVPVFVVAHMMYAHPPYTLNSDCGPSSHETFSPSVGAWDDLVGLQMGVDCTRQQVLRLIDSVGGDAVIVLQSDHGPGYGSLLVGDGTTVEETPIEDLWVRASAFSAVRLPDRCRSQVSDTYAGVNTFRVVFSCISGIPRALEPQSSFWAWYDNRVVVDVTDRLRQYGDFVRSG